MLMCRFVRFWNEHFRAVDRYFRPRKDVKSIDVIKEMVRVQRAIIELCMHLGGLLITQEAKVDAYASFMLGKLPRAPINR